MTVKSNTDPRTTQEVADGLCCLRRNEEEKDVVDDEVIRFLTEGSSGGEAAQPDHCEVVIAFRSNTETRSRMEHTASSSVLDVDEEPVTQNPVTL